MLSVDFSVETLKNKREWDAIFKVLNGKKSATYTLPSKAVFRKWRRDKDFPTITKAEGIHYH